MKGIGGTALLIFSFATLLLATSGPVNGNDNSSTTIVYPENNAQVIGVNPRITASWSGSPTGIQVKVIDLTTNTTLKDWTGLGGPVESFRVGEFLGADLPWGHNIRVRVQPRTSSLTWPVAAVEFTVVEEANSAPFIWHTTGGTTYLRTRQDPVPDILIAPDDQPQPSVNGFRLSHSGIVPGDWIFLTSDLDYDYTEGQPGTGRDQVAVFSSTTEVLPRSQPHRVPGAIDAGVDFVTPNTNRDNLSTDITEDFLVPRDGVAVQVPAGARYIFVSQIDEFYSDNGTGHTTIREIDPEITYTAATAVPAKVGNLSTYKITYTTAGQLIDDVSISTSPLPAGLSLGGYEPGPGGTRVRNITGTPTRTGDFDITITISNGIRTIQQVVSYQIAPPTLTLSSAGRNFPSIGDSYEFTVQASSEWSWSSNVSWITSSANQSQQGTQLYSYRVQRNDSHVERSGIITFTSYDFSVDHTVTQAAAPIPSRLSLSSPERVVDTLGGTFKLRVESNSNWSWSSDAPWITSGESSDQTGTQDFSYSVSAAPSNSDRTGTITFLGGGLSVIHTVRQTPAPNYVWRRVYGVTEKDLDKDPDGDGYTSREEEEYGTDPFDSHSSIAFRLLPPQDELPFRLSFSPFPGGRYQIYESRDSVTWSVFGEVITAELWDPIEVDLAGAEHSLAFFSIELVGVGDSDGDGLNDLEEAVLNSNRFLSDSDFDGIDDQVEFLSYGTNPDSYDTDNDGLNDNVEIFNFGTDPNAADTDGDLLEDNWEILLGFDPRKDNREDEDSTNDFDTINDPDGDPDQDGLTNREEIELGTDRDNFDTDGDLLPDGFEAESEMLDPLVPSDSSEDSDGDGLTDLDEVINETDPDLADTDGDGVDDSVEIGQGSDPNESGDEGQPPSNAVDVDFSVGDPSGSESERWEMTIDATDGDSRTFRLVADEFGTVVTKTFKLIEGATYEITVRHLGSKLETPDYDWVAKVDNLPSGRDESFTIVDGKWTVENQDRLLGNTSASSTNQTIGKKAVLTPAIDARVTRLFSTHYPCNRAPEPKNKNYRWEVASFESSVVPVDMLLNVGTGGEGTAEVSVEIEVDAVNRGSGKSLVWEFRRTGTREVLLRGNLEEALASSQSGIAVLEVALPGDGLNSSLAYQTPDLFNFVLAYDRENGEEPPDGEIQGEEILDSRFWVRIIDEAERSASWQWGFNVWSGVKVYNHDEEYHESNIPNTTIGIFLGIGAYPFSPSIDVRALNSSEMRSLTLNHGAIFGEDCVAVVPQYTFKAGTKFSKILARSLVDEAVPLKHPNPSVTDPTQRILLIEELSNEKARLFEREYAKRQEGEIFQYPMVGLPNVGDGGAKGLTWSSAPGGLQNWLFTGLGSTYAEGRHMILNLQRTATGFEILNLYFRARIHDVYDFDQTILGESGETGTWGTPKAFPIQAGWTPARRDTGAVYKYVVELAHSWGSGFLDSIPEHLQIYRSTD